MTTLGERLEINKIKDIIGRNDEINQIKTWVKSQKSKVLWMYGKGGKGKTTLLHAAEYKLKQEDAFKDEYKFEWIDLAIHNSAPFEKPEAALNKSGENSGSIKTVWVFENFEKVQQTMIPYCLACIKTTLPYINKNFKFIISGRISPDPEFTGDIIEVLPFSSATTQEYWENRISRFVNNYSAQVDSNNSDINVHMPDYAATDLSDYEYLHMNGNRAYQLTAGSPLLLELLSYAVINKGSKAFEMDYNTENEEEFIKYAILQSSDPELLILLEAACLVPIINEEILKIMIDDKYNRDVFLRMTELPFIRYSEKGWHINSLVSHVLSSGLKREAPWEYRLYKQKAFRFYKNGVVDNLEKRYEMLLYCLYLCESSIARQALFTGFTEGAEKLRLPYADDDDMKQIDDCWKISAKILIGIQEGLEQLPEFNDLKNIKKLSGKYFRIVKDGTGLLNGYHATLPVCSQTYNYLSSSPAMSQYFNRLSDTEIKKYMNISEEMTDTYVIRHMVVRDPTDLITLGNILRDITNIVFKGCRLITSTPNRPLYEIATAFGFWVVPNVYDLGFASNIPVMMLDLRSIQVSNWIEWLVLGPSAPEWLSNFVKLSVEEWEPELRSVLSNLSNIEILGKSMLAPIAASVMGGRNISMITHSVEVTGQYLYLWIEKIIYNMIKNNQKIKGKSYKVCDLGELLRLTYFSDTKTRSNIAHIMGLSDTTYYRWLHDAWMYLSESLRESVIEFSPFAENKEMISLH